MTRRRGFWAVFIVLAAASVLAALRLFPTAFPIVNLDLAMDRETAVAEAEAIALRYGWDPSEARTATTFGQMDPEVQTYVELEAGGRDAFVGLAEGGIYHPYVWTVRRFAEGAVEESRVRFTPAGEPYGFGLRLSEEDPGGGNLPEAEARGVAEGAASEWGVDLASFELLETSEERQPGGRVDHTFVFERTGATVGEGRFRLRLRVAGNRPSELAHFVYVPEAFSQRYADMRSANDAIALASQSVFIVLFLLVGGGVGTALLLRRRWVIWRPPVAWGAVTALLLGLGIANTLPLTWMEYDPAVSTGTFLAGQLGLAVAAVVVGTPLLAFVYLAAESLGRRAFPGHLQQWRFWSTRCGGLGPRRWTDRWSLSPRGAPDRLRGSLLPRHLPARRVVDSRRSCRPARPPGHAAAVDPGGVDLALRRLLGGERVSRDTDRVRGASGGPLRPKEPLDLECGGSSGRGLRRGTRKLPAAAGLCAGRRAIGLPPSSGE